MYDRRSNLIYGFHGLDEDIGRRIINGEEDLRASKNHYDWLGHGVYFWENRCELVSGLQHNLKERIQA